MKKGKKGKTMEELAEGYKEFIKGKEKKEGGKEAFEKALKKVIKKK